MRQTKAGEMKSERSCQIVAISFQRLSTAVTGLNRKEVGSADRRRKSRTLWLCLKPHTCTLDNSSTRITLHLLGAK